jgi:hypothetical protein
MRQAEVFIRETGHRSTVFENSRENDHFRELRCLNLTDLHLGTGCGDAACRDLTLAGGVSGELRAALRRSK